MQNQPMTAGPLLRTLRQARGLTLQQAADPLSTSAPVLSRKERDEDEIEREDIRLAIRGYALSPWEAYELWLAAGFIPEPTLPAARPYNLHAFAETLLPNLPFPAFIADVLGYIKAWNQGMEAIWNVSQSDSKQIHVLRDLFSARVRDKLGERWRPYILQALRFYRLKTMRFANDPQFRALIQSLKQQYGQEFEELWNAAQEMADETPLPPVDAGGTIVQYESERGLINYLVVQAALQFPQAHELTVYVPFAAEDYARYQHIQAATGEGELYFVE